MPNDPRMTSDEWRAFEREARGEAIKMAEDTPPLVFGDYVAWTLHQLGATDGLSSKHMAGTDNVTLCGIIIPAKIRRLPVVYKTLKICGQCAVKYVTIREGLSA